MMSAPLMTWDCGIPVNNTISIWLCVYLKLSEYKRVVIMVMMMVMVVSCVQSRR